MLKNLISNFFARINYLVLIVSLLLFKLYSLPAFSNEVLAKTELAKSGQALHFIIIGESTTSVTVINAAADLAEYLGKISGAIFTVKRGDGTEGIAVGCYKDFPALGVDTIFNPEDLTRQDEYLLRSHAKGVYLVGATDLAAQHAVWDFLFRTGYRQFFPTEKWEYIPQVPNLNIVLDDFEQPDFHNRYGPRITAWGDSELWSRWHDRNRITSSFILNTGHSYNGIISRNKQIFAEHPEYLALVDGVRGGGLGDKFCISNENLRNLVVEDARKQIKDDPEIISISMDPSDGSSWCECEECAKMGSVSDRVVILANEVAEAVNKMGYGEKYVGIYAYNDHSPPPTVDVHPNVIVSIATAFMRGGYTVKGLIEGWSEHAELIGIREYYATYVWDQELPRLGPGGSVDYLVEKIPFYYENGARFMNANATDAWSAYGLGFYLSSRLLWDVDAVEQVDELIDDFIKKMFGEAREPIGNFYHLMALDYHSMHTNNDLLAHMYGYIKEARELTNDPKIISRLDDLALYTRYVELWFNFYKSGEPEKAAQDLFRHAYRMQNTMMVNVQQLYRYLIRLEINVPDYADPGNNVVGGPLQDMEPWKSSEKFTGDEISQFILDGVANYQKDNMGFEPRSFSENLIPAAEMIDLPPVSTGDMGRENKFRGYHKMFTWLNPEDNGQFQLEVTGGLIEYYRDRGNVRFKLFSPSEVTLEPVDTDESVPPDGNTYQVVLKSPYEGLHKLEWNDGDDQTQIFWAEGFPMTVRSGMDDPADLLDNRKLYFYVPKSTEVVGGYTKGNNNGRTRVHNGDGTQVFVMENVEGGEGFFLIPVSEGEDGKLWSFQRGYGTQILLTVPPYLARNEKELLLPREVVEADRITNIGSSSIFQDREISVYPNPAKGILHIQINDNSREIKKITFINSEGKIVKILPSGVDKTGIRIINVSKLLPGLYLVKLEFEDRITIKKIILN